MTRATTFRAVAVFSGFLIAILMVMSVSRALFTNPTSNDANSLTSGHVILVNGLNTTDGPSPGFDETGAALFTVTDMAPGDSTTVCFEVRYLGTLNADIVLTTVELTGSNDNVIGDYLNVIIDRHTSATCIDGSPAAVMSDTLTPALVTIGEVAWSATLPAPDSRYYEITIELDAAAPNSVQDSTADGVNFEWLATNT